MPTWKTIKDNWGRWAGILISSDIELESNMGMSSNALKHSSPDKMDRVDGAGQEHRTSTVGLLSLLADWVRSRRAHEVRQRVDLIGRLFLERCLDRNAAARIGDAGALADGAPVCEVAPVIDGRCRCMQRLVGSLPPRKASGSPQHHVFLKIRALAEARVCPASRHWLAMVLQEVATAVDQNIPEWADFQWQHSAEAHVATPTGKRRRVDFHLKQYAIKHAVTSGACASSSAATRSLEGCCPSQAARWITSEIAAYRAECCLCFKDTQVIGVSVDAGRIGKPATELLVGFMASSREGLHAALPPQAPGVAITAPPRESRARPPAEFRFQCWGC